MKDLHQFKIFLKVAEVGSVSKASAQLRIAQPALSRQIRLLEEEAGTPLFTRQWRGMKLTAAGVELQRSISTAVRDLDQALTNVRSLSEVPRGRVRFGLVSTISGAISGVISRRIQAAYPDITLAITDGFSLPLVEWLHRGELDFAIVCGSTLDLHMRAEELIIDELVLIGSLESDLDPHHPVAVRDLANMPLILPSNPNGMRRIIEVAAAKQRIDLNVAAEGDSWLILADLAAAGMGYAVVPLSSVLFELKAGRNNIKYAPIVRPKLTKQLVLARVADAELPPAAAMVYRLIPEVVNSAVRSGGLMGAHLAAPARKSA